MVVVKRIRIHEEYCIGCRLCEIICMVKHSASGKIIKAFRKESERPLPRVRVEEEGYTSFALQCRHCDEAPCVENCLTGAMHRDEATGVVLCDEDLCVGCWMCVMSCPFGVVERKEKGKTTVSKCDVCAGKEEIPPCVKNCPNEALTYE